MPTHDRRPFVPLAIDRFLRQDYDECELVIVDDGARPVKDLVPESPRIHYERLNGRATLGEKRNLACDITRGDVIIHWDDDDWYSPDRISVQVDALRSSNADVCGLSSLLFYDPFAAAAWRYTYPQNGARRWVAGSSMCYTKAFWERNHFDAVTTGEDTRFLWRSCSTRILMMRRDALLIALVHPRNTSHKSPRGSRWRPASEADVVAIMGDDVGRYRAASGTPTTSSSAVTRPLPRVSSRAVATTPPATDQPASLLPAPRARRVLIGIPVTIDPAGLRATLRSLAARTPVAHDVVLLPDGPSAEARAALAEIRGVIQSSTHDARGGAACFNRLVRHSNADVYVLLECGVQVTTGWLERLLNALDAHPNGLAGPSTNRAWNEQAVERRSSEPSNDPEQLSARLAQQWGGSTARLEPLYSLGDFCLAVRRDVVEAVGAADEAYGLGGRWEMDYNIRAARAGFDGVWVKAAYVHRAPVDARRQQQEAHHGAASRARYQAKFCGSCPRANSRTGHCRGEDCSEFARDITVRLDFASQESTVLSTSATSPNFAANPAGARTATAPAQLQAGAPAAMPLVSCIMPTGGRVDLARRAVEYFDRQDYARRELIIVDDGPAGLQQHLPESDSVRYVRLERRLTTGAKRNVACAHARGDLIAQWDDDDWFGLSRLTRQIAPIIAGDADITGIRGCLFFDALRQRFFAISETAHRRMFAGDVVGGTLVYRRSVLTMVSYAERSIGEDASFLRSAVRLGANLAKVDNDDLFVYVRHGRNSWRFPTGHYIDPRCWAVVDGAAMPESDRKHYVRFASDRAVA